MAFCSSTKSHSPSSLHCPLNDKGKWSSHHEGPWTGSLPRRSWWQAAGSLPQLRCSMQIFVKPITGKTIAINVYPRDTILDVKRMLQGRLLIPTFQQRLLFCGRQLQDVCAVSHYGIRRESTLHMVARLRAGMQAKKIAKEASVAVARETPKFPNWIVLGLGAAVAVLTVWVSQFFLWKRKKDDKGNHETDAPQKQASLIVPARVARQGIWRNCLHRKPGPILHGFDLSRGSEEHGACIVDLTSVARVPRFEYVAACMEIKAADHAGLAFPDWANRANPYSASGRLLAFSGSCDQRQAPFAIFEHGQQRVVREGFRGAIEIFWAGGCIGWGARTLHPLEPGQFICEYAGDILSSEDAEMCLSGASDGRDAYLFNLPTREQCLALGALPTSASQRCTEFVIDAYSRGNVARFFNHACGPAAVANVTPIYVFIDDGTCTFIDARLPRVALFANRQIAAGEELRYDYAMELGDVSSRQLLCHCGSDVCRGRIY